MAQKAAFAVCPDAGLISVNRCVIICFKKMCFNIFFLKDFNKMWEFFIIRGITDVYAFIVQPVFLI